MNFPVTSGKANAARGNFSMWTLILIIAIILVIIFIAGCGGGDDEKNWRYVKWECLIAEQSDHFDGKVYHRFYRGSSSQVGYSASTDGVYYVKEPLNPIFEDSVFPVMVLDGDTRYLIVQHRKNGAAHYLYDVTDPIKPVIANGGKPILVGDFYNVGVAIVGGRWHMLAEGKSDDTFHLRYSYADFPDLDFNKNLSGIVINDAGNPCLNYIPEKNEILAIYGADYRATDVWRVRAATFNFSTWNVLPVENFVIAKPGIHMADPSIPVGIETDRMIISVGFDQVSVSTYYFNGKKLDLYNAIMAGNVVLEEDPGNPTMTIDTGW